VTTSDQRPPQQAGPPTADQLRSVQFTHGSMLRPGYTDTEVDHFKAQVADQMAMLADENAALRAQVRALQEQLDAAAARPSASEQAVGILATAQLTADAYVAEAEDFSRQMTSEARAQYEEHLSQAREQLSQAREQAGAIIQAAHEARTALVSSVAPGGGAGPGTEELEEQVAYLRAFGQACRTQLRAYLEALLADVESEWGRAHPGGLPAGPSREQRGGSTAPSFRDDAAGGAPENGAPAAAVPATRTGS
jgi:cell division septum initiation protein DivIVA